MSGYRSLHRQQVLSASSSSNDDARPVTGSSTATATTTPTAATSSTSEQLCPIWHVQTSSRLVTKNQSLLLSRGSAPSWRIWTASADGLVRSYLVSEKSLDMKKEVDVLDASALQLTCTHLLLGDGQEVPEQQLQLQPNDATAVVSPTVLGCTRVSLVRNYVGDDENAGEMLIASMEMAGRIRIWQLEENMDDIDNKNSSTTTTTSTPPKSIGIIKATQEFVLRQATGTTLAWCPPRLFGHGPVLLALACLDGTIVLVASGCTTPVLPGTTTSSSSSSKKVMDPGTVVNTLGSSGTSIALSLVFSPTQKALMAGRQDGSVDLFQWSTAAAGGGGGGGSSNSNKGTLELPPARHIRLSPHMESPVRALSFTTDGTLIMAGSDQGMIFIWNIMSSGNDNGGEGRPTTTTARHNYRAPQLVHHVIQAHASWILDIVPIDHRRFVSCGMDQQLHVWNVGQIHQPVHSFSSDHVVWAMSTTSTSLPMTSSSLSQQQQQQQQFRLVTGSELGWLQIYSLDGKV